mmetsp:Transcript_8457/g.21166  ORF Transcript_8457/g.21166 Transcript_8457/m.21166 type:complete len:206 (+) Transcript_8457:403-1020(+)
MTAQDPDSSTRCTPARGKSGAGPSPLMCRVRDRSPGALRRLSCSLSRSAMSIMSQRSRRHGRWLMAANISCWSALGWPRMWRSSSCGQALSSPGRPGWGKMVSRRRPCGPRRREKSASKFSPLPSVPPPVSLKSFSKHSHSTSLMLGDHRENASSSALASDAIPVVAKHRIGGAVCARSQDLQSRCSTKSGPPGNGIHWSATPSL